MRFSESQPIGCVIDVDYDQKEEVISKSQPWAGKIFYRSFSLLSFFFTTRPFSQTTKGVFV